MAEKNDSKKKKKNLEPICNDMSDHDMDEDFPGGFTDDEPITPKILPLVKVPKGNIKIPTAKRNMTNDFFNPNYGGSEAFCPFCHGSLKIKGVAITSSKSNESISINIKKSGMITKPNVYDVDLFSKNSSEIIVTFQCRICKEKCRISIDDIAEYEGEIGESITINRF